jgi:hypothetical protein
MSPAILDWSFLVVHDASSKTSPPSSWCDETSATCRPIQIGWHWLTSIQIAGGLQEVSSQFLVRGRDIMQDTIFGIIALPELDITSFCPFWHPHIIHILTSPAIELLSSSTMTTLLLLDDPQNYGICSFKSDHWLLLLSTTSYTILLFSQKAVNIHGGSRCTAHGSTNKQAWLCVRSSQHNNDDGCHHASLAQYARSKLARTACANNLKITKVNNSHPWLLIHHTKTSSSHHSIMDPHTHSPHSQPQVDMKHHPFCHCKKVVEWYHLHHPTVGNQLLYLLDHCLIC